MDKLHSVQRTQFQEMVEVLKVDVLLDASYQLGQPADVTLFAVSIDPWQDLSVELSPEVNAIVPKVAQAILVEAASASTKADSKEMARCS